MFITYILKSDKTGRHYIGHTGNLKLRLEDHNQGRVTATKTGTPWKVIHTEQYETKQMANKREYEIKKYKGGILFKKLIGIWKE